MVNVCEADPFAFSEMLRTAKEVKDRDYKKIFIQATEIDSPCPRKMKRVDFGAENPSTGRRRTQLFTTQTTVISCVNFSVSKFL